MTFEQHLATNRRYRLKPRATFNPAYADEMLTELQANLEIVIRWINGKTDRPAMKQALDFFGTRYSAHGRKVYRGTKDLVFDGMPASYTKKLEVAEGFAIAEAEKGSGGRKPFFVIDRKAPAKSLDFSKLLKAYATGRIPRSDEAEVVLLSTPVRNSSITEYTV